MTTNSKPKVSLRERALGFLSRREYSYKELEQKLKGYAEEQDDLPALLEDFKKRGWLSEERYTEQIVHARKGKFGSLKVAHELREHGVAEELISKAVAEVKNDELANARAVQNKKYGYLPTNREEWAKQARFLQSRGFGFDVIKQVLKGEPDEDY